MVLCAAAAVLHCRAHGVLINPTPALSYCLSCMHVPATKRAP